MIKVENLKKNFKGVDVLKGITTEIRKALEAEGVSCAYPHMDVTILNK